MYLEKLEGINSTIFHQFGKLSKHATERNIFTAPWKILSFLAGNRAYEGMGRPRGLRGFRKTHLENILPSPFFGTRIFSFEKFSQEKLLGYM